MTIKLRQSSLITTAGSSLLGLLISIIMPLSASALSIGGPSDCNANAMINCGAHSTQAIQGVYRNGAWIQHVYGYFGISASDINNIDSTAVSGSVGRGGDVYIDSQSAPVATGAITGGRQDIAGSTPVTVSVSSFYKRPPSVSFAQASLPAYVSMVNGRFQFAIIASCGNAVMATPVTPPAPKPKPVTPTRAVTPPAAAPTQTQNQAQSQSVTVNNNNVNNNVTAPAPTVTAAPAPVTTTSAAPASTTVLPNTGPTGVISAFVVASLAGFFGYRRWLSHHLQ